MSGYNATFIGILTVMMVTSVEVQCKRHTTKIVVCAFRIILSMIHFYGTKFISS